eukprot:363864-Chlamydomonas_euryale.AAC.13
MQCLSTRYLGLAAATRDCIACLASMVHTSMQSACLSNMHAKAPNIYDTCHTLSYVLRWVSPTSCLREYLAKYVIDSGFENRHSGRVPPSAVVTSPIARGFSASRIFCPYLRQSSS